ncbi:hypothetical protein P389DRAFT_207465 [Cystobasidium minutum MCA 4210]|uniref:uncharacterized protein n=1 Tax=Cystobasidium minutum MCA 4210 TaxID=1397322 RepID=UPI0034CFFA1B|eukprot:jgi/Rhomi1/207465/estExt_Genemark1.C_1_t10370
MASMVHHHQHSPSTSSHHHSHGHSHPHQHSAGGASSSASHATSTFHSYTPSDFDLLRALTSGSAGKNTAKKALLKQQQQHQRRPQLDPLILETAASSGPHVTRNHFLHEFYPHPEDPSSAFSWHTNTTGGRSLYGHSTFPSTRRPAYASCDVGPEDDPRPHLQGAIEQQEYPTASTSRSTSTTTTDANTAKLPRAVENDDDHADDELAESHAIYRSRQAPRKIRLERERLEQEELEQQSKHKAQQSEQDEGTSGPAQSNGAAEVAENAGAIHSNLKEVEPSEKLLNSLEEPDSRTSIFNPDPVHLPQILKISQPSFFHPYSSASSIPSLPTSSIPTLSKPPLQVVCYARTRVPTPHGEVFLHIYKNNWDDKEHLAFVFDRDQLLDSNTRSGTQVAEDGAINRHQRYGTLRSRTLDATWRKGETDVERIVRGAYVGRLSPTSAEVSRAAESQNPEDHTLDGPNSDDAVLVRIHSECFTGETIGSQRCDCGEQLDEAFRLIGTSSSGLGIIIYLRQEGRGIGLLEKIKAYNLQDLGHDTVTANLLLGHGADQRDYALAGEMLRDLGVGGKGVKGRDGKTVRLLTNNPDKIDSIEKEGIKVVERVPMVPRGWTVHMPHLTNSIKSQSSKKKKSSRNADGAISKSKKDKAKARRPKMTMQDSVTSIRSVAGAEASSSSPLLSPALSSSGFKPKNKKLEALKPLSSSMDADGIRSIEASASEAEAEGGSEDDATVDSYEMPSMPGSADERTSGEALEDAQSAGTDEEGEEDSDEDAEDSEDSAEREEALEDYLISMNRTGVGMIGAGVTHSKELEKYLKTKIERMGHMLVAPAAPPSTPLPLRRGARVRQHKGQSKLKDGHSGEQSQSKDLGESTASIIKTDEESIKCDAGAECEDCKRQEMEDGYFADETYGEDMFG